MEMRRTKLFVCLMLATLACLLTKAALAGGDVVQRLETNSGKVYRDVKWGPVNAGKVVVFHTRGVAIVPLEDLPEEFQDQFGYKAPPVEKPAHPSVPDLVPQPAPPPKPTSPPASADLFKPVKPAPAPVVENNSPEWKQYSQEKNLKVVLDGKLVDKSRLSQLTGFVVATGTLSQTGPDGRSRVPITTLELAQKKNDVAPSMQMRPGLWKGTGEEVVLLDYKHAGDAGVLLNLFVKETDPVDTSRAFFVGKEPSFEQWLKLRNR